MTETTGTATSDVSGARAGADKVFAYLAALMILGVVVQFFLAGLGVFGIDGHRTSRTRPAWTRTGPSHTSLRWWLCSCSSRPWWPGPARRRSG